MKRAVRGKNTWREPKNNFNLQEIIREDDEDKYNKIDIVISPVPFERKNCQNKK